MAGNAFGPCGLVADMGRNWCLHVCSVKNANLFVWSIGPPDTGWFGIDDEMEFVGVVDDVAKESVVDVHCVLRK